MQKWISLTLRVLSLVILWVSTLLLFFCFSNKALVHFLCANSRPPSPPSFAGASYPLCTPAPQLASAHPLGLGPAPSQLMWDGASPAGCKKRVGKELGSGDRAEQIQVPCGNGFSCDVTLVSTRNKKYLSACPFPSCFFLPSPGFSLSLFMAPLKPLCLKDKVICFFPWVPDLDSVRKNLILSGLCI